LTNVPNLVARVALYLASYAPLFLIFALRAYDTSLIVAILFALVALAALVVMAVVFLLPRGHTYLDVEQVRSRDEETMAYVLTYVVPFLGIDVSRVADLAAFALFLIVVGVLYVHTRLLYVNPVLTVLGYRLYRATSGGREWLLVSKGMEPRDGRLDVYRIGDGVALVR
jgi:hypothetical protein